MSNRLRILFHCDLDGPRAFVGRRALERMRAFITSPEVAPPMRVLNHKEWLKRGQPAFEEKRMQWSFVEGRPEILYVLKAPVGNVAPDSNANGPQSQVDFGLSVQGAKMLWKRLPRAIREISQLMVVREGRENCWRQSTTNPRRHGWILAPRLPKTKNVPATQAAATAYPTGNPWLENNSVHFWTTAGLGDLPAAVPAIPTGPLTSAISALVEETFPEDVPQPKAPKPSNSLEQALAYASKPALTRKPKKKFKAGYASPVSDGDSDASPEKPSKPKLKLGIWS